MTTGTDLVTRAAAEIYDGWTGEGTIRDLLAAAIARGIEIAGGMKPTIGGLTERHRAGGVRAFVR
jgi:hypothetical protein